MVSVKADCTTTVWTTVQPHTTTHW